MSIPLFERKLRLLPSAPNMAAEAEKLLNGLPGLTVLSLQAGKTQLHVRYCLTDYTLRSLESALKSEGFLFEDSPMAQIFRRFVYFQESTMLRNLRMPERLIKQSNAIYTQVYGKVPHGDYDDTPLKWRQYR